MTAVAARPGGRSSIVAEASLVSHEKIAQCTTVFTPARTPSHGIHWRARDASGGGNGGIASTAPRIVHWARRGKMRCVPMSTIGVAKYATVSTAKGRTIGGGSSVAAVDRRDIQAIRADQTMTPTVTHRTTWSLPSPKRSVAKALKKTTF